MQNIRNLLSLPVRMEAAKLRTDYHQKVIKKSMIIIFSKGKAKREINEH